MAISRLIKTLEDTMRLDEGLNGDAQYIEQVTWLIFLKVFDSKEKEWELKKNYHPVIPQGFRWRDWADNREGITGDDLIVFINNLFNQLKNIDVSDGNIKKFAVRDIFRGINNYMKSGVYLRRLINQINEKFDFTDATKKHTFNELYEEMLKDLQSAGKAGEFYTPRPITNFIVEKINPKMGESVLDPSCGTGGFLTSTIAYLGKPSSKEELNLIQNNVRGWEKKPLPYLLSLTNLIVHDIDNPNIINQNSLRRPVADYQEDELVDVIVTNPPFGGKEEEGIKNNFPENLRSAETADLFIILIMNLLKKNGRCGIVLPNGLLFGTGNKLNIKKQLVNEYGLHTIIRLPQVFKPYANIDTNLLFFQKGVSSKGIWVYRYDMPDGYKNFTKTNPMKDEHLDCVREWWGDKKEIILEDDIKAKYYSLSEIETLNYDFNKFCPYPKKEIEIVDFHDYISQYNAEREIHNEKIKSIIEEIRRIIDEEN